VEYRDANGPFASIEDIQNVSGIGESTFADIEDLITVGNTPPAEDKGSTTDTPAATTTDDSGRKSADTADDADASKTGAGETISLTVPADELAIVIDAPTHVYVHQPVRFSAEASGIGDSLLDSLQYAWSFGDTRAGEGKDVTHAFAYPGTRIIVVEAAYAHYDALARATVDVLPVALGLSRTAAGDIILRNTSGDEADLGGYALRGTKTVAFPLHTIVAAGSSVTIPAERIGGAPAVLYDAEGLIAASETAPSLSVSRASAPARRASAAPAAPTSSAPERPVESTSTQAAAAIVAAGPFWQGKLPYLGMVGVLFLGALGLYTKQRG
jgi:hypothetical protein